MALARHSLVVVASLLVAACNAPLQGGPQPAPIEMQDAEPGTNMAQGSPSLPFKTVAFDDGGAGRYFAAGASETAVLRSKADLDAFVARRKPAVPPVYSATPAYGSPNPVIFLPPPMPDGAPAPVPTFAPSPLPAELTELDFGKYEAIAYFDGAVKVASLSRVTSVQDLGGRRNVTTTRWEPPPNPSAIPDVNGRLHVIAIARTDKATTFAPTELVDGSSPNGGGYGVGGNPTMRPLWRAVPNPEITQASIEAMLRGQEAGSANVSVEASLQLAPEAFDLQYFTPDSLVWVATVKGDSVHGGFVPSGAFQEVTMLISPETGMVMASFSKTPTLTPSQQPSPGSWASASVDSLMYMGDPLAFHLEGPLPDQPVTLTLKSGDTEIFTRTMPFSDVAGFKLKLDPAHVQGLPDVPAQALEIILNVDHGTIGQPFYLVKDRTARMLPSMSAERGQYDGLDLDASLAKFATEIAAGDWQGQDLRLTSREATPADWALDATRVQPAPGVKLRLFEITGTYPNFFLPELSSGSGAAAVMKPTVVRIVLPESPEMVVMSSRGYLK